MKSTYISLFFLLSLVACDGQGGQERKPEESTSASSGGPEQIDEFGLLQTAEDGGYPFYSLEIAFPERNFSEFFTLNLAELPDLDPGKLAAMVGKYVSFTYTSQASMALLDLRQDGVSLLDMNPADLPDNLLQITGTLSGASTVTAGDLPGRIRIHDPEDLSLEFDFFITPEMVQADGRLVEGLYEDRTTNTILALRPAGK